MLQSKFEHTINATYFCLTLWADLLTDVSMEIYSNVESNSIISYNFLMPKIIKLTKFYNSADITTKTSLKTAFILICFIVFYQFFAIKKKINRFLLRFFLLFKQKFIYLRKFVCDFLYFAISITLLFQNRPNFNLLASKNFSFVIYLFLSGLSLFVLKKKKKILKKWSNFLFYGSIFNFLQFFKFWRRFFVLKNLLLIWIIAPNLNGQNLSFDFMIFVIKKFFPFFYYATNTKTKRKKVRSKRKYLIKAYNVVLSTIERSSDVLLKKFDKYKTISDFIKNGAIQLLLMIMFSFSMGFFSKIGYFLISLIYPFHRSILAILNNEEKSNEKEEQKWVKYWTSNCLIKICQIFLEKLNLNSFPGVTNLLMWTCFWLQFDGPYCRGAEKVCDFLINF
ncbi:hypothetical protein MHBO_001632 [Bonamia ostreae]|uniref:Uncharacterized protein n=1 Tax=Bonamia ostreae TaxID=126728 RepID=A0ABV2AJN4_9EUKA